VSTMSRDICLRCRDTSHDAPSRIRTCGLLLRRESLYPAELSGPVGPIVELMARRIEVFDVHAIAGPSRCLLHLS
jgi:hypothetical protein